MRAREFCVPWWAMALIAGVMACRDTGIAPLITALADLPPLVSDLTISPGTVLPGEPFTVSYKVTASRGVVFSRVVYQPDSSGVFVDSSDGGGEIVVIKSVPVPAIDPAAGAPSATVTVTAVDQAGRMTSLAGTLVFRSPAAVYGTINVLSPAVVGDTLRLAIGAQSLSGEDLAWLGYYVGAPVNAQDSVPVSGRLAVDTLRVPLTSGWTTGRPDQPALTFFSRDRSGHRAAFFPGRYFYVIQGPRRPFVSAHWGGRIGDVLLDTLRGVLYIAQPDSERILRLAIATMTYGSPIALTGRPSGLDLTLGGDSLLVGLFSAQQLGVVNLQTGAVSRLPLVGLQTNLGTIGPEFLREAANGKVLISIRSTADGSGEVWEDDLRTGLQGRRFDAGGYTGPILPIGNPSRLALRGQIYSAATDSMTLGVAAVPGGQGSSDRAGQFVLTGNLLWTSDFVAVRTYSTGYYSIGGYGYASVISPDAYYAYFTSPFGYFTVRVSDGAILEDVPVLVKTPDGPMFSRLIPLPDGQTLIGIGMPDNFDGTSGSVARIDLRPLSPAPHR